MSEHPESSPSSVDIDTLFAEMQPALMRAARRWAPSESIDDVVQDTWMGVLNGIDRFEGRSKLSTWIFGILWRQSCRQWRRIDAKPTVGIGDHDLVADETGVEPGRIAELRDDVERTLDAIDDLPDRYREIIVMRDVLDRPAAEACEVMDLTEANQRVLLHRARGRVRTSLPNLVAS